MPGLFRTPPRVDQITAPAEPSVAQQYADLISRVDAAVRLIDEQTATAPAGKADGLLDIRNTLVPPVRSSVPVIPGRTS